MPWWPRARSVPARAPRPPEEEETVPLSALPTPAPGYWLTRFLILRLLGLVYLMAFLTWVNQGPGLVGSRGLLPARRELAALAEAVGSRTAGFWEVPSIFWLASSDRGLFGAGTLGVVLSLVVLAGYANALILLVLCVLQVSLLPVGQVFYGFGWELQLVETGFLAIFLVPLLDGRPFPRGAPPIIVMALFRWLIVRIMWGSGLIKLRGDPCWRDLTCLDFYFETQPIPSPLSAGFHALPPWAHRGGVLCNHVVELVVPCFAFTPRRARIIAGLLLAALQGVLIVSGNLAFLNWLTLVPILACFDDRLWRRVLPARLVARADAAVARAVPSRPQGWAAIGLGVLVGVLSVPVVSNLLSGQQAMNTSFTRVPLVNTYGAFGSVGRARQELVFEGTPDTVVTAETRWTPYEFKCKPGDPRRSPCWMSPYHYRLDWLMWFAAMRDPGAYPWVVHFIWKLLAGDRDTLRLIAGDPFDGTPPRHVRVALYRYRLLPPGSRASWERTWLGPWLPALSRDQPDLRRYLRRRGWLAEDVPAP